MAFKLERSGDRHVYSCLSTDTKPTTGIVVGAICLETDTGDRFEFDGDSWSGSGDGGAAKVLQVSAAGTTYLDGAITTSESASVPVTSTTPSWQAFLTGTSGALSATVDIYKTKDDAHWSLVGTMQLDVAAWASESDDAVDDLIPELFGNSWTNTKAVVSAISGTGAAVSVVGG